MQKLIEGIHHFRSEVFPARKDFFESLAGGQRPETLFITCSDSRINPNLLTRTDPGELFILRNAGNIIPPYAPSASGEAATVEFAVQGLGVQHIVVCGHTQCGAMKGLLDPRLAHGSPAVARWLEYAESTRRHVLENYKDVAPEKLANVMVQENVLAQVESLRTHPSVKARLARGEISLHAWVYAIERGEVFQFDSEQSQFVRIDRTARPTQPAATGVRPVSEI